MTCINREEKAIDSCQFASMSLVAAILIVLQHLGSQGISKIVAIALPWFFLASGFFLAKHIGEANWYKIAIIKRLRSLVIPFYIWMLVYKICYLVMHWISGSIDQHPFDLDLCLYFTGFHPFIPVQIVWYLRTLFLLVLISPLFVLYGNISLVACSVLLYVANIVYSRCEIANRDISIFFYYVLNISGVLYFTVGILLRRLNLFGRIPWLLDCLLIVTGVICVCADVASVYSIPPIMYLVWRICKHVRIPTLLAKQSLPIYLMHMPVLILTDVVGKWYPLVGAYWLRLFLSVLIPVSIGVVLSRFFPRVRSVLMGGR